MRLRELEKKDAERMLEWMHDKSVVGFLKTDFSTKTIEDCYNFISAYKGNDFLNLAVVNDNDEYMGTVSLRNIGSEEAEFAITVCKDAMGLGYSQYAMREMLNIAFDEYGLSTVYWCVKKENKRAIKFYNKNGFLQICPSNLTGINGYLQEEIEEFIWFSIQKEQFKNEIVGRNRCKQ